MTPLEEAKRELDRIASFEVSSREDVGLIIAAARRHAAEIVRALSRDGYSAQEIARKLDEMAEENR